MDVTDVAVIGGGIAGLAAAWELRKHGLRPVILERSARAGGVMVTERVGGFVIDGGPDSLLVQKPAAVELCHELGIGHRLFPTLPPRTAYVVRGGRFVPLPEASFLGLPTRIGPFMRSPLFSIRGRLRMAAEIVCPPAQVDDESIARFIGRRFGREAVEYLAEPLLAGIHAGDVEQLSMQSLFPRLVELERTHGSVLRGLSAGLARPAHNASSTGAFMSLPGGVAELAETLAAALGPDVFVFDTRVVQISGGPPYKITFDTDAAVHARAVIVAVPAWTAASMLGSLDATLAMLCADIQYASTATVALGFRREQVRHSLNGTGFVVPRRERKTVTAGTWVSSKWPHRAPDGHVLLRAFLGGATDPRIMERNDQELSAIALRELSELLDISGEPSLVRVFRWLRATPQYTVGHAARVRGIDERLERCPGVYVTGSGYRGTGIPDCIADARLTARKAIEYLIPHTS